MERTFLSHFALALAQCTQAIGIRSVGDSILRYVTRNGGGGEYLGQQMTGEAPLRDWQLDMLHKDYY